VTHRHTLAVLALVAAAPLRPAHSQAGSASGCAAQARIHFDVDSSRGIAIRVAAEDAHRLLMDDFHADAIGAWLAHAESQMRTAEADGTAPKISPLSGPYGILRLSRHPCGNRPGYLMMLESTHNHVIHSMALPDSEAHDLIASASALALQARSLAVKASDSLATSAGDQRPSGSSVDAADSAAITQPAKRRRGDIPPYPSTLEGSHIVGLVVVDFVVDTTGRVDAGSVRVNQYDWVTFRDALLAAMKKWEFEPARAGSRKVPEHLVMPVVFRP